MTDAPRSLNLELLIKLLKLTASSNDAEALLAMRKAHEVLAKFGGDWEALLHSKVTVIADPFTAAAKPPEVHHAAPPQAPRAPAPHRAAPQPQQSPSFYHQQQAAAQQRAQQTQARWQAQQRQKAAAQAAAQTPAQPAPTRNTLRKQRISLDDLA